MFKDVGKELKNRAEGYVLGKTVLYGLLGFGISLAVLIYAGEENIIVPIIIGAVSAVIGYFVAREKALMMYAYGELVDCVTQMKRKMYGEKVEAAATPKPASEIIQNDMVTNISVKRNEDGGWQCPFCDSQNLARSKVCQHCGIEVDLHR